MLLAIRFFEPLFGALIVVPFFGLPPWLLRFKLPPPGRGRAEGRKS